MNICHKHKFILWAPPRTAARFVHSALNGIGGLSQLTHRIGVPLDGAGYSIVCTVRNPYTRALSAWKWLNQIHKNEYSPHDFKEFVRKRTPIAGVRPVSQELGHMLEMVKYLVRVESVEADLRALPWVPSTQVFPPNAYRSNYHARVPSDLYDEETRKRVHQLYHEDFVEFDYDPNVIPNKF